MKKIIDKMYGECYNCEELTKIYLATSVKDGVKYGEWLCGDCLAVKDRRFKLSTPKKLTIK